MIAFVQPLPIDEVASAGRLPTETAELIAALLLISAETAQQDVCRKVVKSTCKYSMKNLPEQ
jgi:hypothetical protein